MAEAADVADVRELLDRMQIDDLHSRYIFALDWFDAEVVASLFADDGVLDWAFGVIEGREAIKEAVSGMQVHFRKFEAADAPLRASRLRHFVTNKVMKVDGDRAPRSPSGSSWTTITVIAGPTSALTVTMKTDWCEPRKAGFSSGAPFSTK